jgi:hypothetical protein
MTARLRSVFLTGGIAADGLLAGGIAAVSGVIA